MIRFVPINNVGPLLGRMKEISLVDSLIYDDRDGNRAVEIHVYKNYIFLFVYNTASDDITLQLNNVSISKESNALIENYSFLIEELIASPGNAHIPDNHCALYTIPEVDYIYELID